MCSLTSMLANELQGESGTGVSSWGTPDFVERAASNALSTSQTHHQYTRPAGRDAADELSRRYVHEFVGSIDRRNDRGYSVQRSAARNLLCSDGVLRARR